MHHFLVTTLGRLQVGLPVGTVLHHPLDVHRDVAGFACCSVAFVVRTAVEQHNSSAMSLLFNQPTVQSMGPRAIAGLLQTAIQYKNVPAVLQLSKLKSAHDINTAYLSYLLEEAMRLGHAEAVQCLSVLQGHQTGVTGRFNICFWVAPTYYFALCWG